jgi:hypothetical protein
MGGGAHPGQAVIRRSDLTAVLATWSSNAGFVILVGQGVLGWSADRCSGQAFQDAEEILQEGASRSRMMHRPGLAGGALPGLTACR